MPCIYTLHRVESLVRFHYTFPVFCETPINLFGSAKIRERLWGFSFYGFRHIFSLLTYSPYLPSLLNALWRILPYDPNGSLPQRPKIYPLSFFFGSNPLSELLFFKSSS